MAGLFDTIKQNMQATAQPAAIGGAQDNQAALGVLNAAKSGKAIGGAAGTGSTVPRASNLQEQIAAGQAANAASSLQDQGKLQAAGLGQQQSAQAQENTIATKELNEQDLAIQDNHLNQANALMGMLTRETQQLDQRKKAAAAEQLGVLARMSNEQYTHALDMRGQRDRLDNSTAFGEALQDSIFDDEKDLLHGDLNFRKALGADAREWNEYMSNMGMDDAVTMANANAAAANKQAIWSAIGGLASGGAGMATMKAPAPETTTETPTTAPQATAAPMPGNQPATRGVMP